MHIAWKLVETNRFMGT